MEYYEGKHTGEQIDEAVELVLSGDIITDNMSHNVGEDINIPVAGSGVYEAINEAKTKLNAQIEEKQDKLIVETLDNGNIKVEGIGEFMAATPSGSPQHDLYTSVGAKWNATTGYWEFNGINNMTNANMARSLALANMIPNPIVNIGQYANLSFRTNVWNRNIRSSVQVHFSEAFRGNSILEVLDFRTNYTDFRVKVASITYGFYGCPKLRSILGEIDVSNLSQINNTFYSPLLEEVYLYRVKGNVDVSYSPVFKKECLLYMIQNATPTTAITIKVHADVYAWAPTDAEVQAALATQPLVTLISA